MSGKGFGGRVLRARLNMGAKRGAPVTQKEVADALGVSPVTVGRWEADLKQPPLETIEKLARFLGTSPGYLAFGEAQPPDRVAPQSLPLEPVPRDREDITPTSPAKPRRRRA